MSKAEFDQHRASEVRNSGETVPNTHTFKIVIESASSLMHHQYLLWDFFRDLGEKSVGGEELVKSMQDSRDGGAGTGCRRQSLINTGHQKYGTPERPSQTHTPSRS
jgi:hypothetical protein